MKRGAPRLDRGKQPSSRWIASVALPWLLMAAACAAQAPARPPDPSEPIPPDPEAITVYGRYQPSLESLAPAGIEIGDLNLVEGRLVIQVHAEGDAARAALVRALERSPWYREAHWETLAPGSLREGEGVLSVKPVH